MGADSFLFATGLIVFGIGGLWQARNQHLLTQGRTLLPNRFSANMMVTEPPENALNATTPGRWSATCRVEQINDNAVQPITIRVYGNGIRSFARYDRMRANLELLPTPGPAWPGAFDHAQYIETRGWAATCRVTNGEIRVQTATAAGLLRTLDALRNQLIRHTRDACPGDTGAFLAAALFGYRVDLDEDLRQNFRRVGIGHLLAISGLHVGLIVALAWWCGRFFITNRRWLALACIGICLLYLSVSGGRTAAIRAGLMAILYLMGVAVCRRGDFANTLGMAALVILIRTPTALVDLGAQLSFVAVLFISRLSPVLSELLPGETTGKQHENATAPATPSTAHQQYLLHSIKGLVALSIAAWLGVWPLSAHAFHMVSPLGLLINILAIPMMSLVLAGGMLLQLGTFLPEFLSTPLTWLCTIPAKLLLQLAEQTSTWPGSTLMVASPSTSWMVAYYAGFVLFFVRRMLPTGWPRRIICTLSFAGILLAFVGLLFSMRDAPPPASTTIHLVPQGRGECIVVERANGNLILIGEIRREGLDLTRYLHHRKRGHLNHLFQISATPAENPPHVLAEHFTVTSNHWLADAFNENKNLPYSETITLDSTCQIFISRDKKGRIVWLALTADGLQCLWIRHAWPEQIAYRYRKKLPGWKAPLVLAPSGRFIQKIDIKALPTRRWMLFTGKRDGQFSRNHWGSLQFQETTDKPLHLYGYRNKQWQPVPQYQQ